MGVTTRWPGVDLHPGSGPIEDRVCQLPLDSELCPGGRAGHMQGGLSGRVGRVSWDSWF